MAPFWSGLVALVVFYLLVFFVGVWASRGRAGGDDAAELLLAGRSLPLWVALLTMTATWVGGGYINGTAEVAYTSGVAWGAQPGLGYAISLLVGGLFFARPMRRRGYATLVDPLEERYGRGTAAALMVPAVLAELFWSAAILVALGTTFGTVMGIATGPAIAGSAAVAIGYTVFGGLRAVAYTDVIQLFLIVAGLLLALPFVISTAGGIERLPVLDSALIGLSSPEAWISYGDWTILLILGGIPWNVYFQRVLSSRDADTAARQSIIAGLLCAMMAIPPLFLGLSARSIDWAALGATEAGLSLGGPEAILTALSETPALVLPYLLRLAVPDWVAVLGLGAISAAVMSSVDSSILSASSLLVWNGYRRLINPEAPPAVIARLVRILIVVLGSFATVIALTVGSVAALWYLCGDIVYCVLFPQLALALFDPRANRIGALSGLAVSVFLRLGGGDGTLGLPAFLPYPDWADAGGEFPFRTLAMISGVLTALIVSRLTQRMEPARPLRD